MREAFYTTKDSLTEALFGQTVYITIKNRFSNEIKMKALISKNTKHDRKSLDGEEEYRITWFTRDLSEPIGHVDFPKRTLDYILKTKTLTPKLKKLFSNRFFCKLSDVGLSFVDRFDEGLLNETLYGKNVYVSYLGKPYEGVLSKNPKPGERPYRISWFSNVGKPNVAAEGHIDMDEAEVNYVLEKKQFPQTVYDRIDLHPKNLQLFDIDEQILNESLVGKKLKILAMIDGARVTFPALLSKNTIEEEDPYRITWFSQEKEPMGHADLTASQFQRLMDGKDDNVARLQVCDTIEADEVEFLFENTSLLNESMNVYVQGANYKKLETMGEIAWTISWDGEVSIAKLLEKLPPDQLAYYKKNRAAELFTPDGSYYDEPKGIMNLYTTGLTKQALVGVMQVIFKRLKELGITWGKVKTEQSGTYKSQVIRIPILNNPQAGTYAGPPEVNLANANAYQIFHNVLQYEGVHDFSMDATELMQRIDSLANDTGWIDKNKINPHDSGIPDAEQDLNTDLENPHMDIVKQLGAGGARMIGGGLSGDDIRYRLARIYGVAKWAVDHGFEKIYVS